MQHQPTQQQSASGPRCRCLVQNDLLLWRNPIETGKFFGGALLFLIVVKKVNFLTFFTRLLYTILITTGSIEFLTKIVVPSSKNEGLITRYGIKECPNTVGLLKPYIDLFLQKLPVFQANFRRIVFAYSPKKTFQTAAAFYVANKFFKIFSLWCISFMSVLALFTVPIIYSIYYVPIDNMLEKCHRSVNAKCNDTLHSVNKKLEPYLSKLNAKKAEIEKTTQQAQENSSATTTSAQVYPEVPKTADFKNDIDQLQNDLKTTDAKQQLNA